MRLLPGLIASTHSSRSAAFATASSVLGSTSIRTIPRGSSPLTVLSACCSVACHPASEDLGKTRAQRDVLEKADNELWAAMLVEGKGSPQAIETYKAAKLLSEALGFSYRPADQLARRPVEETVQRVTAIMGKGTPAIVSTAVMGGEQVPKVSVSDAFDVTATKSSQMKLLAKAKLSEAVGKGQAPGDQVVHRGGRR